MAKTAITIIEDIPAATTVNVLAGKRFENVSQTGFLSLAHASSNEQFVTAELFVGTRNALEESAVPGGITNVSLRDNIVVDEVDAFQGEKIQLNVTNSNGTSANTYRAILQLDDNVQLV